MRRSPPKSSANLKRTPETPLASELILLASTLGRPRGMPSVLPDAPAPSPRHCDRENDHVLKAAGAGKTESWKPPPRLLPAETSQLFDGGPGLGAGNAGHCVQPRRPEGPGRPCPLPLPILPPTVPKVKRTGPPTTPPRAQGNPQLLRRLTLRATPGRGSLFCSAPVGAGWPRLGPCSPVGAGWPRLGPCSPDASASQPALLF